MTTKSSLTQIGPTCTLYNQIYYPSLVNILVGFKLQLLGWVLKLSVLLDKTMILLAPTQVLAYPPFSLKHLETSLFLMCGRGHLLISASMPFLLN